VARRPLAIGPMLERGPRDSYSVSSHGLFAIIECQVPSGPRMTTWRTRNQAAQVRNLRASLFHQRPRAAALGRSVESWYPGLTTISWARRILLPSAARFGTPLPPRRADAVYCAGSSATGSIYELE